MNLGDLLKSGRRTIKIREGEENIGNEMLTDPLLLRWIDNIKREKGDF